MSPGAWIRLIGEALGLVREAIPVVEDLTGLEPCPDTLRSEDPLAVRGQAAGAAAQASQAATHAMMSDRLGPR